MAYAQPSLSGDDSFLSFRFIPFCNTRYYHQQFFSFFCHLGKNYSFFSERVVYGSCTTKKTQNYPSQVNSRVQNHMLSFIPTGGENLLLSLSGLVLTFLLLLLPLAARISPSALYVGRKKQPSLKNIENTFSFLAATT